MSDVILPLPELRHSFTGRVRNFNLPPTASNCMMPVYEAVTNALYAIQERFPETWADDGKITIEVLRAESSEIGAHAPLTGFVVTDNGIGLGDALFGHFRELDTEYRADKKGRGIGRLSWIKVFNTAEISSVFDRDGEKVARSFTFRLSNDRPFDSYLENGREADAATGTRVKLESFRETYSPKAYVDPADIRNSLLAHFIALFAQPKRLKIDLFDERATRAFMIPYFLVNIAAILGAFDTIMGKPVAWVLAVVVATPMIGQIWATLSLIRDSDEFVRAVTAKQFIVASGLAMAVASVWGFGESYAGAYHLPVWLIYPLFWFFWGVSAPFIRTSK